MPRVVFPDYTFELQLKSYQSGYTVKNMIDDSRKAFEKERVISLKIVDDEGIDIANITETSILARLEHFFISINNGERIYKCNNLKYLGDRNLGRTSGIYTDFRFSELQDFFQNKNLSVTDSIISLNMKTELFEKESINKYVSKLNSKLYKIFEVFLKRKYSTLEEYISFHSINKEKQITKYVNLFFYLTLTQVVTLNLCTFVFFSWDIMEPITSCITWMNLIIGYYFWALTECEYEIESMTNFYRRLRFFDQLSISDKQKKKVEMISYLEENKNLMI